MATELELKEASQRWIEEGKTYKDAINAWLDVIYLEKSQPTDPEPSETRKDMASFVREQVIAFNDAGEVGKLREMFPPDNEPFGDLYEENFTQCVRKVLLCPDGRIAAVAGNWDSKKTYLIEDDNFVLQPDVILFGESAGKEFIAKALDDRIEIWRGWDAELVASLKYPDGYGPQFSKDYPAIKLDPDWFSAANLDLVSIHVFSTGDGVLLTTSSGIFVVKNDGFQMLYPEADNMDYHVESMEEGNAISLSYPNADLSPDDKYISLGSQDSSHLIFVDRDGEWVVQGRIEPRSSYPHCTKFNYLIKDDAGELEPHVALSSCHFASSATIAVGIDKLTDGFEASGYDATEGLRFIDERNWVYSIVPSAQGYLLGANNGYIWYQYYDGPLQIGYIHIGGTIMSMDMSEDRKTLIVGSYSGQIVKLEYRPGEEKMTMKKNNRQDPFLITNFPWIDTKRYVFWDDHAPMVW